jgi:hypothetical protein
MLYSMKSSPRSIVYEKTERDPARYCLLFVGIPIMIIASIIDQRAFKKELDERQKEKDQAS